MDLRERLESLRHLNPDALSEAELRPALASFIALAEELLALTGTLTQRVEALAAENRRLKGQSPKPKFPGGKPQNPLIRPVQDHSSETERREPKERRKCAKLPDLRIDETVMLACDPTSLPADAVFKGYEERVLQDLMIQAKNTRFRREKFYSPSLGRTFLAPFPAPLARYLDGAGAARSGRHFGPGVTTLIPFLHYGANVGQKLVRRVLLSFGVEISAGQVSHYLTRGLEPFHAEHQEVEAAGLRAAAWVHLDVTGTTVNGVAHACHVLTHPLFTSFRTTRQQDRATVVDVLRGGAARCYRLDGLALSILEGTGVGAEVRQTLSRLLQPTDYAAAAFARLLATHLPRLGEKTRRKVETAALIAAYRADPEWPVIQCLVCDDAAVFQWVTQERALCWVHDARHYQKLNPQFEFHRRQLRKFRRRYWRYYRKLLAYRQAPTPEGAARLRGEFARLFATRTGYADLDTCIARTEANGEELLLVLTHPELPLHNNAAELAARQRVRRRDVSFGPRTEAGRKAWDTFQSLLATTGQIGIRFWDYLWDRITRAEQVPRLADVIAAKVADLQLSGSWEHPLRAAA